jgi:hypothetical protein
MGVALARELTVVTGVGETEATIVATGVAVTFELACETTVTSVVKAGDAGVVVDVSVEITLIAGSFELFVTAGVALFVGLAIAIGGDVALVVGEPEFAGVLDAKGAGVEDATGITVAVAVGPSAAVGATVAMHRIAAISRAIA